MAFLQGSLNSRGCLPAGFARELREALNAETFQQQLPSWRWFFLLHALILKLTIAGVERRHGTHQREADSHTPWHCFCAQSVLSEAKHQAQAFERLEQERQMRRTQAALDAGATKALPSKPAQPKRAKGKGPLELFREEWLRSEADMGRKCNPATKEAWAACREAFENLDGHRRHELEARSIASKIQASGLRGEHKAAAAAAASRADPPLALGPASSGSQDAFEVDTLANMMQEAAQAHSDRDGQGSALVVSAPSRVQGPRFVQQAGCQSLQKPLLEQTRAPAAATEKFPISPAMLKERMSQAGFNLHEDNKSFSRKASHIAAQFSMPNKVEYPGSCGQLCRSSNTLRTINFHTKLVALLQEVVKDSAPQARDAAKTGVVLAVECWIQQPVDASQTPADRMLFFAIGSASGRQAHHAAQVTLAELELQGGRCVVGLRFLLQPQ